MIIDHVGIAVRSIERSIEHWQAAFGYEQATEIVTKHAAESAGRLPGTARFTAGQAHRADGFDLAIHALAQRGGGLHHLWLRCESVDAEIIRLEELGLRVIVPPLPGEAFEDERIAFVYAGDGLSIELIDTERRAGRLPGGPIA